MADSMAAQTLAIDESAGGGVRVEYLNAAICIAHQFGMVLRYAVIIDHHVIILSAP